MERALLDRIRGDRIPKIIKPLLGIAGLASHLVAILPRSKHLLIIIQNSGARDEKNFRCISHSRNGIICIV
jgi:hypothetical protein